MPAHITFLCLTFSGAIKLFSTVIIPYYNPTSIAYGLEFLHILANTYLFFLPCGHAHGCEVASLLVVSCISQMTNDIEQLFMSLLTMCVCILFGEMSIHLLCPLFNGLSGILAVKILYIFWIK